MIKRDPPTKAVFVDLTGKPFMEWRLGFIGTHLPRQGEVVIADDTRWIVQQVRHWPTEVHLHCATI